MTTENENETYYSLRADTGEMTHSHASLNAAARALAQSIGCTRGDLFLQDRSSSCGTEIQCEVTRDGVVVGTIGSEESNVDAEATRRLMDLTGAASPADLERHAINSATLSRFGSGVHWVAADESDLDLDDEMPVGWIGAWVLGTGFVSREHRAAIGLLDDGTIGPMHAARQAAS